MDVFYKSFGIRDLPSFPAKRPFEASDHPVAARFQTYRNAGLAEVAAPFRGLTADGQLIPNLFSVKSTGVSTRPLVEAAHAFLASLSEAEQRKTQFDIDAKEWRAWSNIHAFVMRHGVCLDDCSEAQRARALALLRATCSGRGFTLARNIMRLNDALGELSGRPLIMRLNDALGELSGSPLEFAEWYYWLSIFGEPSAEHPWGWQLDGHHLNINCFVLGDQVVMTPSFFGAEPTSVDTGKHAGTRVFVEEEACGLEFARSLSPGQLEVARGNVGQQRMDGRVQTAAFRDNIELPYAGVLASAFSADQKARLLDLIQIYTGRMRDGHAEVRLAEIARHLDEARFLWVGGLEDNSVFYYRIHSPVVSIEFDHLSGIAFDNDEPSRNHIHTVVRTPNGNDYGKDLLRQHWAQHHAPVPQATASC